VSNCAFPLSYYYDTPSQLTSDQEADESINKESMNDFKRKTICSSMDGCGCFYELQSQLDRGSITGWALVGSNGVCRPAAGSLVCFTSAKVKQITEQGHS
jgi:hypothetical protein